MIDESDNGIHHVDKECCGNCKNWRIGKGGNLGLCFHIQMETYYHEWCGSYESGKPTLSVPRKNELELKS